MSGLKQSMRKILLTYLSTFSINSIPLKKTEEIKFGDPSTIVNADNFYGYNVMAFNSDEPIDDIDSSHPWVELLVAFNAVFASVMDENFSINPATDFNDAVGMLNLGRIARIKMDGESYTYMLTKLEDNLNRKQNGVVCTTTTGYEMYVPIAKWIVGGQADNFIGKWNSTKYRPADDILAGCIIVLCYVMFWYTGFLKQFQKLIKKLGTFSSIDGILRGSYMPLDVTNPATWGALLVSNENYAVDQFPTDANDHDITFLTTGIDIFGLNTAIVDNHVLRGVNCFIYTHAEAFWDRLLTRTQWIWRANKWVSYENIFLPAFVTSAGGCAIGEAVDFQDATIEQYSNVALFGAAAGPDSDWNWRWFNTYVNETITSFKDFYFNNASFAKVKNLFTNMPFSAVNPPGEIGTAGLLVHQFAHWSDGGANEDICKFKGQLGTGHAAHRVLCSRRVTDNNFKFMTIGDITIDDYRTFNALTAMSYVSTDHGVSSAAIDDDSNPLILINGFGHIVTKTEDLPYRVDRRIIYLFADKTQDAGVEYVWDDANDVKHPGKDHIMYKTWVVTTAKTENYPVSLISGKTIFYQGRSADPYKKEIHQVHDVNNLDADLCRQSILGLIWPISNSRSVSVSSKSTLEVEPVVVSAMPEPPEGEVVDVEEEVEQPVSAVGQPVSALSPEKIKKDKAKKDKKEKLIKDKKEKLEKAKKLKAEKAKK